MRVCFVSLSIYGYFDQSAFTDAAGGGAQRQLYLLAKELAEDHDIHFIVGDYGQSKVERTQGIALQRSFRPVGSTLKKPVEVAKLFAAMRRADADVYVSRNKPSVALLSYVCTKLLGKRWVFNVANDRFVQEDMSYLPTPIQRGYEYALQHADTIIAQTEQQQQNLKEYFGVESTIVPNGYTEMDETTGYEDREYFLWVGHLDPNQKRPRLFFEVAKQTPNAEFLLVGARGSKELRESLQMELDKLDNTDYAFDVRPDNIHQYYEQALALVNTSAYEGFPNTYLEAWRAGTPVLALTVDPDRFLKQGAPGAFVADGLSELAKKIRTLQAEPEYWTEVSETAQSEFKRQYGIKEVAYRYAESLETAVE